MEIFFLHFASTDEKSSQESSGCPAQQRGHILGDHQSLEVDLPGEAGQKEASRSLAADHLE
ncbi:hypothetical protein T05_14598 [Trichinella murrelli]|uniref:Uncharacterized protein n=1 Tax=Trichinella murrelli TaxID=144512 RepID=A0A0V0TBX1_9BILA|nr:hypothetical protein T05_14598 [Trichinella murrelli]